MASLKLGLDKRRIKSDGTYPLVFKLTLNRKQLLIKTGVSLAQEGFDDNNSCILGKTALNLSIKRLESIYIERFYQYLIKYPKPNSIHHFRSYILSKPHHETTIYEFWKAHIEKLGIENRLGGAQVYEQSLSTISKEIDLNIPFQSFSSKDLLVLENNLYKRGMSINGVGVYLRSFRAICNRAIQTDLVPPSWYPFSKFQIKKGNTTPRVFSIDEMRLFFGLNLSKNHPEYVYWNVGKLIFMLRGINITDLLLLTKENIVGDRIVYMRAKTGKVYSIAINQYIEDVLSTFEANETLLGLLDKNQLKKENRTQALHQKRKLINQHLKKIGQSIGAKEHLTTYVFRYSYANIAKSSGYSKDLIAEALGHEYGNAITGIYLEPFDLDEVDEMNERILNMF